MKPLLDKVLKVGNGEYTAKDIFDGVADGRMTLWVAPTRYNVKALAVTTFVQYPQIKTCRVMLGAGNLDLIVKNIEPIAEWAKALGCVAIEMSGRDGWERILTDWTKTHIVMRKEL